MLQAVHRTLPTLLLIAVAGAVQAAPPPSAPDSWCGTRPGGFEVSAAIHRQNQLRLDRQAAAEKRLRSVPEASRVGNVAILVDDGSILVQPNQVDLSNFGVQYVPKKGGLVVSPSADPVSEEIGEKIALSDDDSRLVTFPKGFKFRFYNKVHTKMFVHSDGNLSFNVADAESSERSLNRLLGGPPRIAPLFADLNPETATGNGGVYVLASKTKIVVTWLELPEFGQSTRNTFQAVLYPNGRITFAFGQLGTRVAVVGVAPGGGSPVQLLDYTGELPAVALKTAIAERFVATQFLDDLATAQAFHREFADDYDHLVVFLDFPHVLDGAFAYEFTIKNEIQGIGNNVFDGSALAGSKGRLRSFVQMGTLGQYAEDPETAILRSNSGLDLLAHEGGHRWLATLHYIDENGQSSDALLGRQRAHWSFCHNSLASEMEGNLFREDGGDRFTSIGTTEGYSPLDLYAMGLIPPSDVPPFYHVDGCTDREAPPQAGAVITGRRVDVTIDQVIAAEGPRVPASNKAPHNFNMAFVIVSRPGEFPSEASIAKVDRLRAAWEPFFTQITDGFGTVNTALKAKPRR
jgi:hypothetical protein